MGSIGSALNYLKEGLNPMSKMQLGYRTSKAALNMGEQPFISVLAFRSPVAMKTSGVAVYLLHPDFNLGGKELFQPTICHLMGVNF